MANKNRSLDERLREIKTYANLLKKAAKWKGSNDSISHIELHSNDDSKNEYVYEFYCYIRILKDLKNNYDLTFVEGKKHVSHFPKAPGLKKNYPYFSIRDKVSGKEVFQLCAGIKILGLANEYSAPDISFIHDDSSNEPTHKNVTMIYDAKFKHRSNGKVSDSEFAKVHYMLKNLNCEALPLAPIRFHEFVGENDMNGNCVLTNGYAFKPKNKEHHKLFSLKEVELFDIGKIAKVIG